MLGAPQHEPGASLPRPLPGEAAPLRTHRAGGRRRPRCSAGPRREGPEAARAPAGRRPPPSLPFPGSSLAAPRPLLAYRPPPSPRSFPAGLPLPAPLPARHRARPRAAWSTRGRPGLPAGGAGWYGPLPWRRRRRAGGGRGGSMAALARLRARLPALREEYFRRNRYPEGPAARWRRSAKNRWLRSLPPPAPGLVLRAKGRPQSQGLEPAVVPYTPPAWACPLSAHSFIYLFTYLFRLTENPPVAERADGSDPHCLKLSSVKQTGQLVSLAPEIRLVFFFFSFSAK